MKQISVRDLLADTYFSEPVYLDEHFIVLSPETPVTKEFINRLVKWRYGVITTDGEVGTSPISEPTGTASAATLIDKSEEEERFRREAVSFFSDAVKKLNDSFARFRSKNELRGEEITGLVKDIMQMIKSHRQFIFTLPDISSDDVGYIINHSVKTAIFSLAIADQLKIPPFRQIDIGTSALCHAIGLLRIPEDIYMSDRQLSAEEKKTIAAHPAIGFKVLQSAGFPAPVCRAVLEQNERLDGSGLPRRVTGDKLSVYGKILEVAISYNAAVSKRPYKSGVDGHTGLMDLLKDIGTRYDETILKALVFTLSVYPIGTYVLLSNGAKAIVTQPNPSDPKYPVIKILVDDNGVVLPGQPIYHTGKDEELQIARPLTGLELDELKGE